MHPNPTRNPARIGLLIAALCVCAAAAAVAQKGKKVDLIWTAPGIEQLGVRTIALMPALSFDNNLQSEHLVENAAAQSLRPLGYRWRSPTSALALLKGSATADSLWRAQRAVILKNLHVDSLAAGRLCAAMRVNALLTYRIDLFERHELEWNQTGKPSTSVQIKAALVDSSGRLLWTASGSETLEGTYKDAGQGVVSVKGSGLSNQPMTGNSGAPTFDEVLAKLFERWA
ncbi:MAG: hypothetical protein HOP12_13945, partial [Candidatus Eisenbacteria bacterium]|nr:hypothetical protein [Candidatus Eisenbacteria bacterium]